MAQIVAVAWMAELTTVEYTPYPGANCMWTLTEWEDSYGEMGWGKYLGFQD